MATHSVGRKSGSATLAWDKDLLRQVLIVLAVVATIIVNGLANGLPLNGKDTGEISDRFNVYFVPAGYVFSIWGLIYLGLIAYAIFQALPAQRTNPALRKIGGLFLLSSAANIAWIFLWHYEQFPLTILVMLALLGSLIGIYLGLRSGRTTVPAAERWIVRLPFSIYLGWISVATIANASALLDYLNWTGWGLSPETWTVIMLAATAVIAALMSFTRRDAAYLAVLVWALAGIALKHAATPVIALSTWAVAGFIAALLIFTLARNLRRQPA